MSADIIARAQAQRVRRDAELGKLVPTLAEAPAAIADPFTGAIISVNVATSLPAAGSFRMIRWVAPRTTNLVGLIGGVTAAAGNIEGAVFDEHLKLLGSTGSIPCPTGSSTPQTILQLAAIPVVAGRSYWLAFGGTDTTTLRIQHRTVANINVRHLTAGINVFPAPARIQPRAQGWAVGTSLAISLTPMLEPALTAKITPDLTMSIGEVLGRDGTRIFARTGGGALTISDDLGATWTTVWTPTGETVQAVAAAGDYLFVGTRIGSLSDGSLYRFPRNGPYTTPTTVYANHGGYSVPWNLVAYDDGLVMVGSYGTPNAVAVTIRRSADFGATWTTPLNLGPGNNTESAHVHTVFRHPTVPTKVYANVGDAGLESGVYVSSDSGATFTRIPAFGDIRLTPALASGNGVLWGSDQVIHGGNLFYQASDDSYLEPRSMFDAPWHGDVYAMHRDSSGRVWYFTRGEGIHSFRRSAIFMTPDDGLTTYLAYDFGFASQTGLAMFTVGGFLFFGTRRFSL